MLVFRILASLGFLIVLCGCQASPSRIQGVPDTVGQLSPGDLVVVKYERGSPVLSRVITSMSNGFEAVPGDPFDYFLRSRPQRTSSLVEWQKWSAGMWFDAAKDADGKGILTIFAHAGVAKSITWGSEAKELSESNDSFAGDTVVRALNDLDLQRFGLIANNGMFFSEVVASDNQERLQEYYVVNAVIYSNKLVLQRSSDAGAGVSVGKGKGAGVGGGQQSGSRSSFFAKGVHGNLPESLGPREQCEFVSNHWRPVAYQLVPLVDIDRPARSSPEMKVSSQGSLRMGLESGWVAGQVASYVVPPKHTMIVDAIEGKWTYDKFAGVEQVLLEGGATIDITLLVKNLLAFGIVARDGEVNTDLLWRLLYEIWQKDYVGGGHAVKEPLCPEQRNTSDQFGAKDPVTAFEEGMKEWVKKWLAPKLSSLVQQGSDGVENAQYALVLNPEDFIDDVFGSSNRTIWKRYCWLNKGGVGGDARVVFKVPEYEPPYFSATDGWALPRGADLACFPDRNLKPYSLLAAVPVAEGVGNGQAWKYERVTSTPSWRWRNNSDRDTRVYFGMNDNISGDNLGEVILRLRVIPTLEQRISH